MQKNRVNILFILTDDQGAWAMGCAGNQDVKTPNLDRLAERGIRFSEFYCASPVCSPARATLVTGKMPSCHGVQDWIEKGNMDSRRYPHMEGTPDFDPRDRAIDYLAGHKTYMEILAENGYQCALSGKWHLGDNVTPKKGFSRWYTIGKGGCRYYYPDICDEGELSNPRRYVTDLITERALQDLEEMAEDERPFYLSVHYTAPHSPWGEEEHPAEYRRLYEDCAFTATPDLPIHPWQARTCPIGDTPEKRRENLTGYYAALSAMDEGVGKLLKRLEEKGMAENTVVIFTSDNGMNMGHHGIWGKGNGTYPPNMYDSSIKVPFIISLPDGKHSGEVCKNMVSQYDVFPTILELAGCEWETEALQPGRSLVELFQSPEKEMPERVVVYDEYSKTRMIKKNHYKYIHRYGGGPCEFYDLRQDPEEVFNLYGDEKYREITAAMRQEMELWFAKYTQEKTDARKYDAKGRGQWDLCWKDGAFNQGIEMYYAEK
ncbi:sulfatase-like hydrolase/transferase [Mediterraneibacter hominis]|nr:sulfatase-like hydrolase/transferase [Mediterraneibacter hominis]